MTHYIVTSSQHRLRQH